ncbi:hypothetical protein LZ32DRAFT_354799 [Colletotrichum eremochloae]|nr:hypothetical protein LZ32DRAFT_354799 [Colletotrichum eremochloae]
MNRQPIVVRFRTGMQQSRASNFFSFQHRRSFSCQMRRETVRMHFPKLLCWLLGLAGLFACLLALWTLQRAVCSMTIGSGQTSVSRQRKIRPASCLGADGYTRVHPLWFLLRTIYLAYRHRFRHSPDQGPGEWLYGGAWTHDRDRRLDTPDLVQKRKPISLIVISLGGDHRYFVLRADWVGARTLSPREYIQLSSSAVDETENCTLPVADKSYDHERPGYNQACQRRERGCYPATLGKEVPK